MSYNSLYDRLKFVKRMNAVCVNAYLNSLTSPCIAIIDENTRSVAFAPGNVNKTEPRKRGSCECIAT